MGKIKLYLIIPKIIAYYHTQAFNLFILLAIQMSNSNDFSFWDWTLKCSKEPLLVQKL